MKQNPYYIPLYWLIVDIVSLEWPHLKSLHNLVVSSPNQGKPALWSRGLVCRCMLRIILRCRCRWLPWMLHRLHPSFVHRLGLILLLLFIDMDYFYWAELVHELTLATTNSGAITPAGSRQGTPEPSVVGVSQAYGLSLHDQRSLQQSSTTNVMYDRTWKCQEEKHRQVEDSCHLQKNCWFFVAVPFVWHIWLRSQRVLFVFLFKGSKEIKSILE